MGSEYLLGMIKLEKNMSLKKMKWYAVLNICELFKQNTVFISLYLVYLIFLYFKY